jgi:D-aminopeptidase
MRCGSRVCVTLAWILATIPMSPGLAGAQGQKPRARDLGIPLEGVTGPLNAITDVPGVQVGHATIIRGEAALAVGKGSVRTGVTAILPRGKTFDPVFAARYVLNGNGELTGTTWIDESGFLETPILITNTFSVGVVRDAALAWMERRNFKGPVGRVNKTDIWMAYPVVGETFDGILNDIVGQHVTAEHAFQALDGASAGPVPEGNVGGGTGMIAHHFKGGIGTASRRVAGFPKPYHVGVLVQANHGVRTEFTVAGVPVGREITDLLPDLNVKAAGAPRGSIIVIVATDAPLLPHQLKRLAQRIPLGIGRLGGAGENGSGDIFLAFSTANPGAWSRKETKTVEMISNDAIDPLFYATVQATEEAILNAMVAAETMTGRDGITVHALPHDRLREVLRKFNRLSEKRR